MKINYNWLKDYVGDTLPAPDKVAELLTAHAFEIDGVEEVDNHVVIDVDVLPNRSSDCLCHRGVARELASILGIPLAYDPLRVPPTLHDTNQITVSIDDTGACPRFSASLITGIEVKESPGWLQSRLESLGQRSINNIVDATNYVMYALGQPLHAYDADLFPQTDNVWQFGVRYALVGEVVNILPEGGSDTPRRIECVGTELLIVDKSTDTPIGLAGVKGGQFAGVHADTTRIIVEAAHFDPVITRKTARRLGIVIDASKRFENEPAKELSPYGQYEVIKLIKDIAGGTYEGTIDKNYVSTEKQPVRVRISRVNTLLGLTLSEAQVTDLLTRTGSTVEKVTDDSLLCVGPWERTDLDREVDFIEEVGRLYGLTAIESVPPVKKDAHVNKRQYYAERLRQLLLQAGYSEVITSSFQKKDSIQLKNALASDKSYVRSSLRKNITQVLDANFVHGTLIGTPVVKVFEIGTVFTQGDQTINEHTSLAVGARTKGTGSSAKDAAHLEPAMEALYELTGVEHDLDIVDGVIELNFDTLIVDLSEPIAYDPVDRQVTQQFKPISPYPAVSRDIALWVQEGITAQQVHDVLATQAGTLCVRIDLFDTFEKEGRTSYGFRLVFLSHEKTLTDSEVNTIMDRVTSAVGERGWEAR